jgi:hypothetical protein
MVVIYNSATMMTTIKQLTGRRDQQGAQALDAHYNFDFNVSCGAGTHMYSV